MIQYSNQPYAEYVQQHFVHVVDNHNEFIKPYLRELANICFMHSDTQRGSLLDVGCYAGSMQDSLVGSGWAYEGIDFYVPAIDFGKTRGRNVHARPQFDSYDVVFCRQVLQFLPDVPAFIQHELEAKCKVGGIVCIVQSIPYLIEGHHYNSMNDLTDLLACLTFPTVMTERFRGDGEFVVITKRVNR